MWPTLASIALWEAHLPLYIVLQLGDKAFEENRGHIAVFSIRINFPYFFVSFENFACLHLGCFSPTMYEFQTRKFDTFMLIYIQ